jgi:hypothetical protein
MPLIRRCAWHRPYRRWLGIASWRGWRITFTDGMCATCALAFRAAHKARPELTRDVMKTWVVISQMRPRLHRFRVVCAEPRCSMNDVDSPAFFVALDTAEAWARDHADAKQHFTLVQTLAERG